MTTKTEIAVTNVLNSAAFEEKIKTFIKNLIKATVEELVESLEKKIDDVVKTNNEEIKRLDDDIKSLNERLDRSSRVIAGLESQLDTAEQYSRRNCLIISGVKKPATTDEEEDVVIEDTDQIIKDLATKMKMSTPITTTDIDASHRLKSGKIIVKFVSRNVRNEFFSKRKALDNIYVSENLTKRRQDLLYKCRNLKREKKIEQCWTTNGSVKVKLTDGKIQTIENMDELKELVK